MAEDEKVPDWIREMTDPEWLLKSLRDNLKPRPKTGKVKLPDGNSDED